ncbi:MAG: nitroreductase family protein [Pseudomonadales bacterium]|nr:nitroreductase family protein [Pseudomonadales bacterium]
MAQRFLPYQSRQRLRAWSGLPARFFELLDNYLYDLRTFTRHSSSLQFFNSRQQRQSWIDADYHKLEKGLALPAPRAGFGKPVAERLVRQLQEYRRRYDDDETVHNAISVLSVYQSFNQLQGVEYTDLFEKIASLKAYSKNENRGGYEVLEKRQWQADAEHDLLAFFQSRRSIRDFSSEPVSLQLIKRAMEMAKYTPTVCNRQAARVHAYTRSQEVQQVIRCQMGNSGFGDRVQTLLMVTVDRACFFSAGERNQCWIDGGLLAMSVVYALHSLGVGSCCLNWSVTRERDQLLRQTVKIKDSEAVIMMIAVGHLKDSFRVAKSPRKPLDHFLVDGIQTA